MLKLFCLIYHCLKKATLAFIISALLIGLSCGKRKPPIPPQSPISTPKIEVLGIQRGNIVFISATFQVLNNSDFVRADLFRLVEPSNSSSVITEDEFADRGVLITSSTITEKELLQKQLKFSDALDFSGQSVRLYYAVRLVNKFGQKEGFSNFVQLEPASEIAESPFSLTASVSETKISLDWQPPAKAASEKIPISIIGYNVYRINENNENIIVLNSNPITATHFDDKSFKFENRYKYFVRTISLGKRGEPIESLDSNSVFVVPRDIFPPSSPKAITIAAAPANISIFFAKNAEEDVLGYKIYRSGDPNIPLTNWLLLTPAPILKNAFADSNVKLGNTYYYYLIAVDKAGNASAPSEIVSEKVP